MRAHVGDLNDANNFAERMDIDAGVPEYLMSGKIGSPRSGEFAENSGCDDAAQAAGEATCLLAGRAPRRSRHKVGAAEDTTCRDDDALRSFAKSGLCQHLQPCAERVDCRLGQPGNLRVR